MIKGSLFHGKMSYSKGTLIPTTEEDIATAKTRLCGYDWFGINEWGTASLLLLYQSAPFDRLLPSPEVFGLELLGNVTVAPEVKTKKTRKGKKGKKRARQLMVVKSDSAKAITKKKMTNWNNVTKEERNSKEMRVNSDVDYEIFKRDFAGNGGKEVVRRSNLHDVELYAHATG
eukprot:CAMPEP_0194287254 /NCGR_PEP_ID=MMETSP0169-20130528/34347_1 /TAXON_ID=218684 /ORGANISM="Corethron pennatum, Strain L29A3" /LENGTH=172 /DNA_ID=CAMNT_0039033897 /DNA_START=236 /DNA_END=751 /DNA_ORIENTATION=+